MPSLLELQRGVADAVRRGDAAAVADAVEADGIDPAARLGIYRNHFLVALGDVLTAAYPVVARLVGDDFFRAAARRFVQSAPPTSPCLSEYGGGFPAFLGRLAETGDLPYIADVARLEWALAEAAVAADAPTLPIGALSALGLAVAEARFHLHPSVRLVASAYPVDRIWQANSEAGVPEVIDLDSGDARLLVHRRDGEVGWHPLVASQFAFIEALARGSTLATAGEAALEAPGPIDFEVLLGFLLEAGVFTSFSQGNDREEDFR